MRWGPRLVAVTGGVVCAATGAIWGSKDARWFGLARDSGDLQLWLGVGVALVLARFSM